MEPFVRKHLSPIRVLYIGRALEGAAYSSLMPFILLHFMKTLGLTAVASGFVISAREMVPIFTAIAMGWAISKISRRDALVASLSALCLASLVFKTGLAGMPGLFAAALLSGLAYSAMRIAFASSIPDFMEKEESVQGFAMLHSSANIGYAIGPLLSGYWVAKQDYASAFWVAIGLYLLAAVTLSFGLPRTAGKAGAQEPASIREIGSQLGWTGALVLFSVFAILFVNGIRVQIDLLGLAKYFVDYFHSTTATSLYWTIQSLAIVFLVPMSGRVMKSWPVKPLFYAYLAGSVISAMAYVSLGFFGPESLVSGFVVMTALSILGECLWAPCMGAIFLHLVGKRQMGLIFGISSTVLALGLALGSSVGGVMLDKALSRQFLPFYWQTLGMISLPAFAALALLGFVALRLYLKREQGQLSQAVMASQEQALKEPMATVS